MDEHELMPWEQVGDAFRKNLERAGMLIDLDRCIGCHSCSVSCKTENEVPLGNFRMRVRYLEEPEDKKIIFAPLICMHCTDAPCLKACPSKAVRRQEDGRVYIDEGRCDLEQECVDACPYGAISINTEKEVAEKCDFCTHRTDVGLDPACVQNCPTDALVFGDLADPGSKISRLAAKHDAKAWKPEAKTDPSVLYVSHDKWMEKAVNTGVQLDEKDEDITYEQNNLGKL